MSIRFFWYADVLHIDQVRKGCENMAVSRKKRAGRALLWAFLFLSGVLFIKYFPNPPVSTS